MKKCKNCEVNDWEVAQWEAEQKEFLLLVCSGCGFIASEIVEHDCDATLQDWWHLNVKSFQREVSETIRRKKND